MLNTRLSIWIPALLAAALGTYILYDANPGLNWGIWVAATSLGLLIIRQTTGKPVARHTLMLLGWAAVIAFAQTVTGVEPHSPLIIGTVAILLGLAVVTLDDRASGITLQSVAQVPFAAVGRVAKAASIEALALPARISGLRDRPVLRGTLFAIPIVLILIVLLSSADPIFDAIRNSLLGWLDNWVIDGRIVFFLALTFITLGAYALASGEKAQLAPPLHQVSLPGRLGRQEERIIIGAVSAVLWLFVLLQIFSLTRDPGGTAGTGLTYAEYARQGFAELSVAAALVLGVILFLEVFRAPSLDNKPRRFELAAIFAVILILASAFRRVVLYESAYGYTTDRLIAQTYMLVLGAAFILLAWDLSKGAVSAAFGRRGMMLTLTAITAFTYWNYEAWIVEENLKRARNGSELDLKYLQSLSIAAVPALIEARSSLTPAQRAELDESLRCRRKLPDADQWFEWNLRVEKARAALEPYAGTCPRTK